MSRLQYSEKERHVTGWICALLPCWYRSVAHSLTLLPSKPNTFYTVEAHCLVSCGCSISEPFFRSAIETFNMVIHEKHGELISGSSPPSHCPWYLHCQELLGHLMCYLPSESASFALFRCIVSRCGLKAWQHTCIWCRNALLIMSQPGKACMSISLCEIRQWNSNE